MQTVFQKIQERSLEPVFFSPLSPASDSDANGHRTHCKTPLFFTRLGFTLAINHTFANLENSSLNQQW